MIWKWISLILRVAIAVVLGRLLLPYAGTLLMPAAAIFYGIVLWIMFGIPLLKRAGGVAASLYMGDDSEIRLLPEYSVAEARVSTGKYQEAVDEYRKVIVEYPTDIYPHLRIAELALDHLNDESLAELELLSAVGKAEGEDSATLAAGRLADFYQLRKQDPARALEVMKQLRVKIPNTKQARLAEERIATLEEIVAGTASGPKPVEKIAHRQSRYKMPD